MRKERKRIEEAVAVYIADMTVRLGDNGTCAMARSMFSNVDPVTKIVVSKGRLFSFLETLSSTQRPTHIAEITPAHLTEWRASWNFGSDLTAANRWSMAKDFFNFCEVQGWIAESPARRLKPMRAAKGGRTAVFTDEQYSRILNAMWLYDPENVPARPARAGNGGSLLLSSCFAG